MSGLSQNSLPFVPPSILPASFRLKLPFRSARELVVTTAWVSEHTSLERVYRMFGSDPSLPGLAILRDRLPLGLLTKNALVERFSYRFSHELFEHKPATAFMDPSPIVIEAETSLDSIEKTLGWSHRRPGHLRSPSRRKRPDRSAGRVGSRDGAPGPEGLVLPGGSKDLRLGQCVGSPDRPVRLPAPLSSDSRTL